MKHLILLAALASTPLHAADADINFWLDLHVGSHHFNLDYVYNEDGTERSKPNEKNYGLGISIPVNDYIEARGGFYDNTWNKTSFYAAANIHMSGPIALGVTVGGVTGYDKTPQTNLVVMPMAIPTLTLTLDRVRAEIGYIPPISGLYSAATLSLGVAF